MSRTPELPEHPEWTAPLPAGVALFGGTFDPPHLGHCLIAQDVCERFGFDRICFVPAAQNPLKPNAPSASDEDRRAMLEAIAADDSRFTVLDWELAGSAPSYTIDTVRRARREFAEAPLYWILGADQLPELTRWREPRELARLVTFLCVDRPGAPPPAPPDLPGLHWQSAGNRMIDISSTEIRERRNAGMRVDFFLPPGVYSYLADHDLYSARNTRT